MLVRHGKPDAILHFLGGLGDELLLTCVAHEIRRRDPDAKIWQITAAPDALRYNPDYALVLGAEQWELRHSNLLERWRIRPAHSPQAYGDYTVPPRLHVLHNMCLSARLHGKAQLRPWFFFAEDEQPGPDPSEPLFCMQSMGIMTYVTWAANKTWFHERFEDVIERIRSRWPTARVVQLGSGSDLRLRGADDLRGKTSIRESAVLLRQSRCFIGTEGFLMHLARAVECRSVIVFGGRVHAWQTGYPCNENLETRMDCAPCWLDQHCDSGRACMNAITAADVEGAVLRAIQKRGMPLETTVADLDGPPPDPPTYPRRPGWSEIAHLPPFEPVVPRTGARP
jgi:ADP-heptose:LPS heptosyltransferase